jgi:hypothetical protein
MSRIADDSYDDGGEPLSLTTRSITRQMASRLYPIMQTRRKILS